MDAGRVVWPRLMSPKIKGKRMVNRNNVYDFLITTARIFDSFDPHVSCVIRILARSVLSCDTAKLRATVERWDQDDPVVKNG